MAGALAFHASHRDELLRTDIRCIPVSLSGSDFVRVQEYAAPRGSRTRWTNRTSRSGTCPSTKPYEGSFDESTTTSLPAPSATPRAQRGGGGRRSPRGAGPPADGQDARYLAQPGERPLVGDDAFGVEVIVAGEG